MRLELHNVSCGYQKKEPVIERISMDLNGGEICCILGPNGVGKTTLFKTLLGIIPVLRGSISINGQDVTSWKAKERSRVFAYVAQAHVPVFPYKTEDIVMMGRLGQIGRFSQPTRHDFEVTERAMDDMGLDYLRGAIYTEISGGERQLLMIARALAQEPDILILDEPTANLDYGNMARVLAKMKSLAKRGLCILFTSHMPDQAFLCDAKAALLFRNRPMLFGPCEQVITARTLQEAYHAPVQVAEIIDRAGHPLRMCAPRLEEIEEE